MNKKISMTKGEWQKIRTKGILHYLIYTGFFKLGLIVGLVYQLLAYFGKINYEFEGFDFVIFFKSYLTSLPITVVLGVVVALWIWSHFEGKFKEE